MPRKESCCEPQYDLFDEIEILKYYRDPHDRLKVFSLLLHKREEEIMKFGYPKTTCYYSKLEVSKIIKRTLFVIVYPIYILFGFALLILSLVTAPFWYILIGKPWFLGDIVSKIFNDMETKLIDFVDD